MYIRHIIQFVFVFITLSCAAKILYAQTVAPRDFPIAILIPQGPFLQGSTLEERLYAYQLDEEAYGSTITRDQGWYDHELPQKQVFMPLYRLGQFPVTNAQYSHFITSTGYPAPYVDEETWNSYGLKHSYKRVEKYLWENGQMPPGRDEHPVVLVSYEDALAYTNWLSRRTGRVWRLPNEAEWEKGIRGPDGRYFPWGNHFNPEYLNSNDRGPFDTRPVGSFAEGDNIYDIGDGAGQVFEWTSTSVRDDYYIVKGGSWDDQGCGVCRPAARHPRHKNIKHILIGFRILLEPQQNIQQ